MNATKTELQAGPTMRRLRRGLLIVASLVLAVGSGACGGGNDGGAGSASVRIDSVDPAETYPGVETAVSFSITPNKGVSKSDLDWEVDFGDGSTQKGEGTSGEATHAWEQSGRYTVEVRARANGSTVGEASQQMTVRSPIDLAVSNIQPRPPQVDAGGSFQAVFDVENKSPSEITTPFEVDVFLTQETSVEEEEISKLKRIGNGTLEANGDVVLEAESTRTAQVNAQVPDDLEGGDYRLVPWIRPKGQFADKNPGDNFKVSENILRVSNIAGQLPDVAVEEVFVIPDRAFPALNEFQRGFTLRNKGGAEAFEVKTETYLSIGNKTVESDDIKVNTSQESYDIPPETSREIGPDQFVLDQDITAENGQKTVYVLVKAISPDSAQEPDTDNNLGVSDPPIVVSDELADGPDIVVESFEVSPEQTYLNGTLEVSMKITNQGNADVGTFTCGLYAGEEPRTNINSDVQFSSVNITSLASQKSKNIERTVTVAGLNLSAGSYHVYTYCDPTGALNETYRNNNAKLHTEPVEITAEPDIDMRVASIDVPKTAQEGNEVTIQPEICVTGSNASGASTGELYETTGTQVNFDADPKTTFSIPNINPGECKKVDVTFEADCEDFEAIYAYGARIDTEDVVPENDEMNNRATAGNNMEIQGPYCKCNEDSFEENDTAREAATLSPGQTSAAVCTPGECDFYGVALQEDESLRVTNTFLAEKGGLETTLFDPSGVTSLDADTTPGRQSVATFNVSNDGTYLFSICGATSSSRNLYDMDVEVLPQPSGVDLIPREVELPSSSTYSIGAELQTDLRIHNIGDTKSGTFDVSYVITPDRQVGDGNDIPVTPATVRASAINGGSQLDLSTKVELPTSLSNGNYYIAAQVDPSRELNETDTSNNVSFSKEIELQTRCFDPLEPNDSFSTATKVSSQSYNNLSICASEDDYYKLCVQTDKKFEVTTSYDPSKGDVDLELYNRNQTLIDSSATTGIGSETVRVDYVNGDQCYFIRPFLLTRMQQLETSYSMSINVQQVAPSLQCDSYFEPNDTFGEAASLISALQTSSSDKLDRCPTGDEDYYYFKLDQGQTVSLSGTIDPSNQSGTLRMQLYKPNQQPTVNVETAPGISTAKINDYTAPTTGTYYLQITMSGSQRRATYTLGASGLGGIDLQASNLFFVDKTYSGGESFNLQFDVTNLRSTTATTPSYTVYLGDAQTLDSQNDTQLTSGTLGSDVQGNSTVTEWASVTLPQSVPSGTRYIHVLVETDSSQTDPNTANNVATKTIELQ